MQKRKLQVFVSSTYTDLIEERQAAVEAILSAGHIPAGMELFAAGDQSQWDVIKQWIQESDVYMLIIGARYGSIEQESGKSYTQLEYEYAIELNKPFFAVVITDKKYHQKVKKGLDAVDLENYNLLQNFKKTVESKMVSFWNETKDIELAIFKTLAQFAKREELIGWIPGDQGVNGAELAEEIARLTKENSTLRDRLAQYSDDINGMAIEDFIQLLKEEKIEHSDLQPMDKADIEAIQKAAGDEPLNLFHVLRGLSEKIDSITELYKNTCLKKLSKFGIIKTGYHKFDHYLLAEFTDPGRRLFMYLKQKQLTTIGIAKPATSQGYETYSFGNL